MKTFFIRFSQNVPAKHDYFFLFSYTTIVKLFMDHSEEIVFYVGEPRVTSHSKCFLACVLFRCRNDLTEETG